MIFDNEKLLIEFFNVGKTVGEVGKRNNSELVKAVKHLKDKDNKYIVILDNSFDNLQVIMEQKLLKNYADEKDNVVLMDII